jgi:pimeloyl-[acyl-carrier protein] methyl ester esterase
VTPTKKRALLLPGLDGTGEMFQPMVETAPEGYETWVHDYQGCGYGPPGAMDIVEPSLPVSGKAVLVAESYSGPLAVRLAAAYPSQVSHVVLGASFVRAPVSERLLRLSSGAMVLARPPRFLLRALLLGWDAAPELVERLRDVVDRVPPSVLGARLREIRHVDVTEELRRCEPPILYLEGTEDRLVGSRGIDLIREVRPDVKVERVRAPHLVLQREPDWAWEKIVEFVEG